MGKESMRSEIKTRICQKCGSYGLTYHGAYCSRCGYGTRIIFMD